MTTRRTVLWTAGSAIVIAGAAAAGWAATRTPRAALEPWTAAGESFGDPRLDALAYAILAPNPHNMQPWRAEFVGDDSFDLYADPRRLLPETDPPNRQITIGFGCFLELFRQAAAEKGRIATIIPFPDGEPQPTLDARPIARVSIALDQNVARDPLFAATLQRRTNRGPYDGERRPDEATLAGIVAAGGDGAGAPTASDGDAIKDICRRAWEIEWTLDRTRRESIKVMRIGKREIEAAPDGLSLSGPAIEALSAAGLLTREGLDREGSAAYEQPLKSYSDAIDLSPAFVLFSTETNTRADQLAAGRAWVRMHQAATLAGVAMQPLSQALQEFAEMAEPYAQIHALLAPGATLQMLARVGYAPPPPIPSPRHPVRSILVRG